MNYNTTIERKESKMTTGAKCMCGGNATLRHKAKLGRVRDEKVTVFNVPVYSCENCGFSFMNGSDSRKFAICVDEAVKKDLKEVQFK